MATTNATITLSSADLTNDVLALTQTTQLNKAGTSTGLNQTTGLGRKFTSTTGQYTLVSSANFTDDKAHKVYLKNTSSTVAEYFTIEVNTQQLGHLYAGDWAFFPWASGTSGATAADIKISPSAINMTLEYMVIFE
jgi:hypothetical protein